MCFTERLHTVGTGTLRRVHSTGYPLEWCHHDFAVIIYSWTTYCSLSEGGTLDVMMLNTCRCATFGRSVLSCTNKDRVLWTSAFHVYLTNDGTDLYSSCDQERVQRDCQSCFTPLISMGCTIYLWCCHLVLMIGQIQTLSADNASSENQSWTSRGCRLYLSILLLLWT